MKISAVQSGLFKDVRACMDVAALLVVTPPEGKTPLAVIAFPLRHCGLDPQSPSFSVIAGSTRNPRFDEIPGQARDDVVQHDVKVKPRMTLFGRTLKGLGDGSHL